MAVRASLPAVNNTSNYQKHIKVATSKCMNLMNKDNSNYPHQQTALIASELLHYNIDIAALSKTRLTE